MTKRSLKDLLLAPGARSDSLAPPRRPPPQRERIEDNERTILSAKDRAAVLAALDDPAEPTDELKKAMALRQTRVAHRG